MVSLENSLERQIKTIAHELMHFMFIKYYWDYCQKDLQLSEDQTDMIKEALTVFLNTDFKKWIKVEDKGHTREQELRKFLLNSRPETKNFNELLEKTKTFFN